MPDDVTDTLAELESALEGADYRDAKATAERLFDAYDRREPDERAVVERVKAANRGPLGRGETGPFSDFLATVREVQLSRAGASTSLGLLLATPEGNSEDVDLRAVASDLLDQERKLRDESEAVQSRLDSATLPASPRLLAVDGPQRAVPTGSAFEIAAHVGNVGDEAADDVTVTAEPGESLAVVDGGEATLSLDSGSRREHRVTLRATEPVDRHVPLKLRVDDGDPITEQVPVEALDAIGFVERADRFLEQLQTRIEEADGRPPGSTRRFLAKVEAARKSLERARSHVERGEPEQADNAIGTASKQLGALLNTLATFEEETGRGPKSTAHSERERVGYEATTELVLELLARGREARV